MRMWNESADEYTHRLCREARDQSAEALRESEEAKRLAQQAKDTAATALTTAQNADHRARGTRGVADCALWFGASALFMAFVNSICNSSLQTQIDGLYASQSRQPLPVVITHTGLPTNQS